MFEKFTDFPLLKDHLIFLKHVRNKLLFIIYTYYRMSTGNVVIS